MDTREKLLKNTHRVDFLAHKEMIETKLLEGHTAKALWKLLYEDGVISMSYSQFTRHLKSLPGWARTQVAGKSSKDSKKPATSASTPQTSSKRALIEPPKVFSWNPMPLSDEEIKTGIVTSR